MEVLEISAMSSLRAIRDILEFARAEDDVEKVSVCLSPSKLATGGTVIGCLKPR